MTAIDNDTGLVYMSGKYIEEVRKHFGKVSLSVGTGMPRRIVLCADKVLPNFYRNSHATVEKDPLFILVPFKDEIEGVWQNGVGDEVRYGTAYNHSTGEKITNVIGIQKDTMCLYICLKPLTDEQIEALEIGSLGL